MKFDHKTRMIFPNSELGQITDQPWFPYLNNNWRSAEKPKEVWDSID